MNVLFSSINSVYRTVHPPTDRKNLSGLSLCFLHIKKSLLLWEKGDRDSGG